MHNLMKIMLLIMSKISEDLMGKLMRLYCEQIKHGNYLKMNAEKQNRKSAQKQWYRWYMYNNVVH